MLRRAGSYRADDRRIFQQIKERTYDDTRRNEEKDPDTSEGIEGSKEERRMEARFVPGSDHNHLQERGILQMKMTVYYKRTAQEPWQEEKFDSEAKMPHERMVDEIAEAFRKEYKENRLAALQIEYEK